MPTRRNFLQHTASVVGGAVAIGSAGSLMGQEHVEDFPPASPLSHQTDEWYAKLVHKEANEICNYHRRFLAECDRVGYDHQQVRAISVPFASLPMSVYLGGHFPDKVAIEEKVAPPDLSVLLAEVELDGGQEHLQDVLNCMWARYPFCPTHKVPFFIAKQVKEWPAESKGRKYISLDGHDQVLKSRIVTPRYTVDMEELTARRLAECVYNMMTGLQAEMDSSIVAAVTRAKEEGLDATPHYHFQAPRVAAKLQAFMWDCMAWTVAAGWIGKVKA